MKRTLDHVLYCTLYWMCTSIDWNIRDLLIINLLIYLYDVDGLVISKSKITLNTFKTYFRSCLYCTLYWMYTSIDRNIRDLLIMNLLIYLYDVDGLVISKSKITLITFETYFRSCFILHFVLNVHLNRLKYQGFTYH